MEEHLLRDKHLLGLYTQFLAHIKICLANGAEMSAFHFREKVICNLEQISLFEGL